MTLEGQQSGARILVVDDEDEIRRLIMSELEHDQHQVTGAATLFEVQVIMSSDPPDLVVLDLNLQDGDGLAFCKEARMKGYRGAIIMVTARDTAMDRVIGLEIGADDYLIKPFEPRELRVRVRNLLGRTAADSGLIPPSNPI
jgi:two-component system OmpR family response regulator